MATDPRNAAEAITRQRREQEEAKEALRAVFGDVPGWRRLASGSFSSQIGEGVRAVVAAAPTKGYLCNIRVGSRIITSRNLPTPQEALDFVNSVKGELGSE